MAGPLSSQAAFEALTGRPASSSDVWDMLYTIGGPASTRSGINLTAAAQALGVTRRTVERWVAPAGSRSGRRPSGASAQRLAKASRQMRTTKAGRARAMAGAPGSTSGAPSAPRRIKVTGTQGPSGYERARTVELDLDPAAQELLQQAYIARGESGVVDALTTVFDQEYVPGWNFVSMDQLGWR